MVDSKENYKFDLEVKGSLDQCQCQSNCAPTPPLTQQQSTDIKVGSMFGWGRGRCAVARIIL